VRRRRARKRRLPGFRFEAQPPPLAEVCRAWTWRSSSASRPSGPLDLPVAVEDASQFEAIFGADAPLAWDAERGESVRAFPRPAVRAFFRNGGRRCWVVRVAGSASGNLFPVTGLVRLGSDGRLQPAFARARSKGSWSDSLQTAAALTPRPLVCAQFNTPTDFHLEVSSPDEVVAGDLLRFTFEEGYAPVVVVKAVEPVAQTTSVTGAAGSARRLRVRVKGRAVQWFRLPGKSPTTKYGRARLLTVRGARIGARAHTTPDSEWRDDRAVTLNLQLPGADAPALGSFVRATFGKEHLWLRVDTVRTRDEGGAHPGQSVQVSGEAVWWYEHAPDDLPRKIVRCEKLLFELRARRGDEAPTRLAGLAFAAEHPRFWSGLPADEQLYHESATRVVNRHAELWRAAAEPRFPLAGREEDAGDALYFPVVMPTLDTPYLGHLHVRRSALQRDGLATFDRKLFLDFELDDEVSVETLLSKADFIRYQSPRPRHLRGIHAALNVEEATIISVPDAVHRGWTFEGEARPEPEQSKPLPHPEWWAYRECNPPPTAVDPEAVPEGGHFLDCGLARITEPALTLEQSDETGTLTLSWSSRIDERRFVVEESAIADWRGASQIYSGTARQLVLSERDPRLRSYFRVRAEVADISSEWEEPTTEFDDDGTTLLLTWADPLEAKYVLEEATRADWEDAAVIYEGAGNRLTLYSRHGGDYFYRVRAVAGRITSDWSQGVAARIGGQTGWNLKPPAAFRANTLLEVHVALLRMCAARGDLFAMLSLPEHYRDADAVRHAGGLRASSRMARPTATQTGGPAHTPSAQLGYGEQRALSYGALYHPWLVGGEGDTNGELRRVPPCGAAAGIMALRSFERGAWVAPANEPLRGVLALTPSILPAAREALQEAQVNLIRREPRGFLVLAADTLSDDPDLRPVGVRRLLILLRRAALRLGATYVFEPHSDAFRRLVRRGFEGMLGEMFQRGAFAGATPSASFRVNTGSELNTPQLTDNGRFIVELKVAPSLPLTFLTLRLVQSGDRGLATEER
jgi:hypothetical protein